MRHFWVAILYVVLLKTIKLPLSFSETHGSLIIQNNITKKIFKKATKIGATAAELECRQLG